MLDRIPFKASGEVAGRLIKQYRRHRSRCVYCTIIPDTDEHPVGKAIGGRLDAPILCGRHNVAVGTVVDDPMAVRFAFVVAMVAVPRQGGQVGATFMATLGDGSPVRVSPDGRVTGPSLNKLIVHGYDTAGKIVSAEANLKGGACWPTECRCGKLPSKCACTNNEPLTPMMRAVRTVAVVRAAAGDMRGPNLWFAARHPVARRTR